MALPTGGFSQGNVQTELNNSQIADDTSLQSMINYIFGSWVSGDSLQMFGGYGNPNIATFTVVDTGSTYITVEVSMNNYGSLTCYFWAKYRKSGSSTWKQEEVGSASSGSPQFDITGLDSSTEYEIQMGVYNKFNNKDVPSYLDWTATGTATTDASSWSQDSAHFNGETPDDAEVIDEGGGNYSVKVYWTPSNVPSNATGLYLSYDGSSTYYDESSGSWSWSDGWAKFTGYSSDTTGSVAYADDVNMKYGDWLNFGGLL